MKILCPKCETENETEAAVAGLIQCTGCAEWFGEPSAPAPRPQFKVDVHARARVTAAEKIRRQAESFCTVAIVVFSIGGFFLLLGISLSIPAMNGAEDSGHSFICWLVMGAAFTIAFWLYLVGQIIHIRANTEK